MIQLHYLANVEKHNMILK